jgi:hypothetical protein
MVYHPIARVLTVLELLQAYGCMTGRSLRAGWRSASALCGIMSRPSQTSASLTPDARQLEHSAAQ